MKSTGGRSLSVLESLGFNIENRCKSRFIYNGHQVLYSLSGKTSYRQISERLEKSKAESRGFEASRDLAVGRPSS